MKEFDVVKIKKATDELPAGAEGAIINEHKGGYFSVEFLDKNGDVIDIFVFHRDELELVWEYPDDEEEEDYDEE